MSFTTIEFERAAGVATLALNRPDRLNAFNATMHEEVRQALDTARDDDAVRCLLITGRGRGFCAGQDLSDRSVSAGDAPPDLEASIRENYNPLIRRITSMPKPVVCAVNGVAAGAGANIALAADIVIATASARFIQAFCHVGLMPDGGGTWLLPRLAGNARALGMAMLGEPVSAAQAEAWGLIWKCVEDNAFESKVAELCARLAAGPTVALALAKRAIAAGQHNTLETQLDIERDFQRSAAASGDYHEGVRAFLAKRKPAFRGR
jgi:2-(1,2-epoxy-1,2-dihydrophenyl)acetyl-CoA isomerase